MTKKVYELRWVMNPHCAGDEEVIADQVFRVLSDKFIAAILNDMLGDVPEWDANMNEYKFKVDRVYEDLHLMPIYELTMCSPWRVQKICRFWLDYEPGFARNI